MKRAVAAMVAAAVLSVPAVSFPALAQSNEAAQTVAQWNASNTTCRNADAPALEAIGACEQRDRYSKLLALMNQCYGPVDKAGQATWSPCDAANPPQDSALAPPPARFPARRGVLVLPARVNRNART